MAQFRVPVYVLVGLLSISKSVSASDPCTSYATLTGEVRRSAAYTLTPSDTSICDNFLTEQWYKIDSLAGNEIVRTCPSMLQCSTMYPLWMNGSLPDVLDGEADRTICQSGIGGCCESSFTIKVKNCGSFYVYDLKKTTGCPVAYCFGTLYVDAKTITTVPTTTESTSMTTETTTSTTATITTSSVAMTTTRENSSPLIPGKPKDHMHKHPGDKRKDMWTTVAPALAAILVIVFVVAGVVVYCKNRNDQNNKVTGIVGVIVNPYPKEEKKDPLETISGTGPTVEVGENMPKLKTQKLRKHKVK